MRLSNFALTGPNSGADHREELALRFTLHALATGNAFLEHLRVAERLPDTFSRRRDAEFASDVHRSEETPVSGRGLPSDPASPDGMVGAAPVPGRDPLPPVTRGTRGRAAHLAGGGPSQPVGDASGAVAGEESKHADSIARGPAGDAPPALERSRGKTRVRTPNAPPPQREDHRHPWPGELERTDDSGSVPRRCRRVPPQFQPRDRRGASRASASHPRSGTPDPASGGRGARSARPEAAHRTLRQGFGAPPGGKDLSPRSRRIARRCATGPPPARRSVRRAPPGAGPVAGRRENPARGQGIGSELRRNDGEDRRSAVEQQGGQRARRGAAAVPLHGRRTKAIFDSASTSASTGWRPPSFNARRIWWSCAGASTGAPRS